MGFRLILLGAAFICITAATASAAPSRDPLIEGARLCTQNFPVAERAQSIPNHLLAAISSTESGRWHKQLGMALPWPWTINVEGKGYYFASKAEAIAQTQNFLNRGVRSIDVGCMQVNLKHHPRAFANLNQAFDPATNVAYAAKFLRTNYDEMHDWIKATAAYHSRTSYYGRRYLVQIEKSWNRIVTKVAQARTNQGLTPQATVQPNFTVADAAPATPAKKKMNRIKGTRSVKVITVSSAPDRRHSDVMVVRREPVATPIRLADASSAISSDMMVKMQHGVRVTSAGVDSAAPAANSAASPATGPKFVFAN